MTKKPYYKTVAKLPESCECGGVLEKIGSRFHKCKKCLKIYIVTGS